MRNFRIEIIHSYEITLVTANCNLFFATTARARQLVAIQAAACRHNPLEACRPAIIPTCPDGEVITVDRGHAAASPRAERRGTILSVSGTAISDGRVISCARTAMPSTIH